MCTQYICFEQKYENSRKNYTENCHFYSREKSLYIAWACFLNELKCCFFSFFGSNYIFRTYLQKLLMAVWRRAWFSTKTLYCPSDLDVNWRASRQSVHALGTPTASGLMKDFCSESYEVGPHGCTCS